MAYKLTLDINLLDETPPNRSIETLQRWTKEGKISLSEVVPSRNDRSPAYGWPGSPVKPPTNSREFAGSARGRIKRESTGKANFNSLARVLFPYKDPQKLEMVEINDAAHLVKHRETENDFFITQNFKHFIDGGKRERLSTSFGIIVMTPAEIVTHLATKEGWK